MWQTPVDGLSLQGGATADASATTCCPTPTWCCCPAPPASCRWQANASLTYEWDFADRMLARVYWRALYRRATPA